MSPRHGHGRTHRRGQGRPRTSRTRQLEDDGSWTVNARVEKFVEPALLLVLRDLPGHGYEIADEIESLLGGERVDLGNLYRLLRKMEEEELVSSTWTDGEQGKGKRTYEITASGLALLDGWIESLRHASSTIEAFIATATGEVQ